MKKSKLTVITDILIVFTSFFMLIFTILSDRYYTLFKQAYFFALPNSMIMPLANIEPVNFKCRKHYSPLFTYTSQGNHEGCYAKLIHLLKDIPCSDERLEPFKKGAIEIPEIDRDEFHIWRNVSICGKRYAEDELNMTYAQHGFDCPAGYIDCGYIDAFGDRLCIGGPECPITYINITHDVSEYDSKNYTIIPLTAGKFFVYSRQPNFKSFIPFDFAIGEDLPCVLTDRISFISKPFPLTKNKDSYGCDDYYKGRRGEGDNYDNYLDHRYILLDSISTTEFYERNEDYSLTLFPSTETWSYNTTSNMNLYYRPRVRINTECVNNKNRAQFSMALDTVKIKQFTMVLLNLGNILFLCVFISILSMMRIVRNIPSIILGFIKLLFALCFIGGNTYLAYSQSSTDNILMERMHIATNLHCMDRTTLFSIQEIHGAQEFLDSWESMNTIIFYSCIPYSVSVVIQLVWYVIYLCKKFKKLRRIKKSPMGLEMLDNSK
jgi:hypothetical protein